MSRPAASGPGQGLADHSLAALGPGHLHRRLSSSPRPRGGGSTEPSWAGPDDRFCRPSRAAILKAPVLWQGRRDHRLGASPRQRTGSLGRRGGGEGFAAPCWPRPQLCPPASGLALPVGGPSLAGGWGGVRPAPPRPAGQGPADYSLPPPWRRLPSDRAIRTDCCPSRRLQGRAYLAGGVPGQCHRADTRRRHRPTPRGGCLSARWLGALSQQEPRAQRPGAGLGRSF